MPETLDTIDLLLHGVIRGCPNNVPYCNAWELATHFAKHGHKFAASDASEYENIAEAFLNGPLNGDTQECTRPDADRVRFGFVTHYFGVTRTVPAPECIRTFYPVKLTTIAGRGGEAGYFNFECGRHSGINL
ncbi:MAG TPA: hypothetical protein VHF01_11105 [Candidatus Acidoferrum sp.]|nr:hypothetical protein [Candidatus Acidoferrum sp.]